ncbi:MAG: complex I subunit 5 family protein [Campylobacterales bacterium]
MSSTLIPLMLVLPILSSITGFVFKKRAVTLGLVFSVCFFTLSIVLLYEVSSGSVQAYSFGAFTPPLGISFLPTSLGSLILAFSSFVVLIVSIYAAFYLHIKHSTLFFPLLSFLVLGFVVVYLSRDIFNIYVGLEIVGLSAVGLSVLEAKTKSIRAAIVYLFATLGASGLYLLGVALIYSRYGLLDMDALSLVIEDDFVTLCAFTFMVLAFMIKTALFPLSFWLPNAHANALSPVSALLSGVVIKATFYLLFLYSSYLFDFEWSIYEILAILGVVAIFYGGVKALLANDLKLIIAYSTISQIGYLFVVFGMFSQLAYLGMVFTLLSHLLAKSGLFLASGVLIKQTKTRSLKALKGAISISPISVFAIGLSSVSLIGLPPSLGFMGKWYYLQSSFEGGSWIVFGAVLGGGVLSAIYLFKMLIVFLEKPLEPIIVKPEKACNVAKWSAFSLSFLSVFAGLFSYYIIDFLGLA